MLAGLLNDQWERTQALQRAQGRIISWVFHREGEPIGLFTRYAIVSEADLSEAVRKLANRRGA